MQLHANIIGAGKPFLILHGFLGMSDNWKTLGKQFAKAGYEVHLIDQRNHGKSFHSDVFNYDALVQDLKLYCDERKLKDVILLGHSMGGKTAMLFSTQHPDYVSKLIVADISPRFYPVHHDAILEGLNSLDFNTLASRGEADEQLSNYVSDFGTRQFLLKNLYWVKKGTLGLRINLQALTEHVGEVGEALPVHAVFQGDTLFLKGDKSEYISPQDEATITSHFINAKIETIANAGHWLHAENPEAFYKAVMQFIK
ncbi:alpha/beta fold hydrolase [Lacinutrix chionoecetis]